MKNKKSIDTDKKQNIRIGGVDVSWLKSWSDIIKSIYNIFTLHN
jgi:hypothetical protein